MLRAATRTCSCHISRRLVAAQNVKQAKKQLSVVASTRLSRRRYSTLPETSTYEPKRRPVLLLSLINNLHPRHIVPEDYIDLSSQYRLRAIFDKSSTSNDNLPSKLAYYGDGCLFPSSCKGFLYFYEDPSHRPNVSGLRFRLAKEATQEAFDRGEDLEIMNDNAGAPWSYSLLRLWSLQNDTRNKWVGGIFRRLKADGLVDLELLARWGRALEAEGSEKYKFFRSTSQLLPSLDAPFELDLSQSPRFYRILDEEGLQMLRLRFSPHESSYINPRPYKGRCLVRLERLDDEPLVIGSRLSFRTRVLKILTPFQSLYPSSGGLDQPVEGSLFSRNNKPIIKTRKLIHCPSRSAKAIPSEEKGDPVFPRFKKRQISTLNPARLQSSDYLDFSNRLPRVHTLPNTIRWKHLTNCTHNRPHICGTELRPPFPLRRWPAGARGFLYFHHDPMLPLVSASIRLRVTSDASIEGFRAGKDLLAPGKDRPWELPLLQIVNSMIYGPLVGQLMEDGLISEEAIAKCKRIGQTEVLPQFSYSIVLWHPEQPFEASFRASQPSVQIIDLEQEAIFCPGPAGPLPLRKYDWSHLTAGKCRFRLELLPDLNQLGQQQCHLRILDVLEPIHADPASPDTDKIPEAGSLFTEKGVPIVLPLHRKAKRGS